VDEMFDTHLINVALVGLSVSAGVAILIAAAIIGIAAIRLHRRTTRTGKPAVRPAGPVETEVRAPSRSLEGAGV
jgi:hypothetical protein